MHSVNRIYKSVISIYAHCKRASRLTVFRIHYPVSLLSVIKSIELEHCFYQNIKVKTSLCKPLNEENLIIKESMLSNIGSVT